MRKPREWTWTCPDGCGATALITQIAKGEVVVACLRCHPPSQRGGSSPLPTLLTRWSCASGDLDVVVGQEFPGDVFAYCLTEGQIPHIQPNADPSLLPKGDR